MKEGEPSSPEDIGTIMEMFAMEYSQAESLYKASGSSLNTTIEKCIKRQKLLPPGICYRQPSSQAPKNEEPKKGGIARMTNIQFAGLKAAKEKEKKLKDEYDKIQTQKQQRERKRLGFRSQYLVKKSQLTKKKRLLTYKKKVKGAENTQQNEESLGFISRFQQYLGKPISFAFKEQLNEAFQELWDARKFIVLHILNLSQLKGTSRSIGSTEDIQKDIMKGFLKDIYLNQKFASLFNKEFINYGIDPKHFQVLIYPHMKQFVNLDRDKYCLIILRLNEKTSKVTLAAKLSIFEFIDPRDFEGTRRRIIDKKKDINRIIDSQICPSIHHNPLNTQQKRKLDEDRKIRNQQQLQYQKMKEKSDIQRRKQRQDRMNRGEQSDEQIEKMKQAVIESISQLKAKEREMARAMLSVYEETKIVDPIAFKLRFPNGQQKLLTLPKSETLKYIFTYIDCLQEDLGFENKQARSFDLSRPLQSQFLQKQRNKTLAQIFEDSIAQVLIVKEI